MAELIPLDYRVAVAQKAAVNRWIAVGVFAAVLSAGSLAYAFGWKHTRESAAGELRQACQAKATLIAQARALQERRSALAGRMDGVQQLLDDHVLLSLLQTISDGFSASDCVEYINIDAHGRSRAATESTGAYRYTVHITGITANENSHAELLSRLTAIGAKSNPPLTITPESLRREKLYDGQVMRFQILCERPG